MLKQILTSHFGDIALPTTSKPCLHIAGLWRIGERRLRVLSGGRQVGLVPQEDRRSFYYELCLYKSKDDWKR